MTDLAATGDPVEEAFRALGSSLAAGIAAGVLVGGGGGRVVMRVSAIAADSDGLLTEGGNRVGDITIAGTLALIVFGGALFGLLGGVVLYAARPWLPRGLALRALLFAALLPLMGATTVITSENTDFRVLDPPGLNVAMFAALFVAFGGGVVVVAEAAIDRALPRSCPGAGAGAVFAAATLMGPIAIASALLLAGAATRPAGVLLILMGSASVLRFVEQVGGALSGSLGRAVTPLGYGSLIGACLVGSVSVAREVEAIL